MYQFLESKIKKVQHIFQIVQHLQNCTTVQESHNHTLQNPTQD